MTTPFPTRSPRTGLDDGGALRRRFLIRLAAAGPGLLLPKLLHAAAPTPGPEHLGATLAAYVDTLLPADALTPAASALGVHRSILDDAAGNAFLQRLFDVGSAWLDQAADGPFRAATPAVRAVVVDWMATAPLQHVPRRFYEILRAQAIERYYSQPAALAGLAVMRPPQPLGYFEPWA